MVEKKRKKKLVEYARPDLRPDGERYAVEPHYNPKAESLIIRGFTHLSNAKRLPDSVENHIRKKLRGMMREVLRYEEDEKEVPANEFEEMKGEVEKIMAMLRAYR